MRVLGVDGGQSGIRLRLSDAWRATEVEGVSRGEGDIVAAVAAEVRRGWARLGAPAPDRVVLGLTTAPSDPAEADRLATLVARATGAPEVWVADDSITAHAGALGMGPGVGVVAGTGVACLALPPHGGAPRSIGGAGFLLGDEGGAFWIGSRGVNAAIRAADGRGGRTALVAAAEARFGPIAGMHVRLHDADRPVDAIARFAPDVLAAAEEGDPVAWAIAEAAAGELAVLVAAGVAHVRAGAPAHDGAATDAAGAPTGDPSSVAVALGGRLLEQDSPLRRRLEAALATDRAIDLRAAAGTALDGAIRIGAAAAHPYGALVHRWPGGPA
jgi:glucosamine kinase